jgi:hypothetical protein
VKGGNEGGKNKQGESARGCKRKRCDTTNHDSS